MWRSRKGNYGGDHPKPTLDTDVSQPESISNPPNPQTVTDIPNRPHIDTPLPIFDESDASSEASEYTGKDDENSEIGSEETPTIDPSVLELHGRMKLDLNPMLEGDVGIPEIEANLPNLQSIIDSQISRASTVRGQDLTDEEKEIIRVGTIENNFDAWLTKLRRDYEGASIPWELFSKLLQGYDDYALLVTRWQSQRGKEFAEVVDKLAGILATDDPKGRKQKVADTFRELNKEKDRETKMWRQRAEEAKTYIDSLERLLKHSGRNPPYLRVPGQEDLGDGEKTPTGGDYTGGEYTTTSVSGWRSKTGKGKEIATEGNDGESLHDIFKSDAKRGAGGAGEHAEYEERIRNLQESVNALESQKASLKKRITELEDGVQMSVSRPRDEPPEMAICFRERSPDKLHRRIPMSRDSPSRR